jgi:sugar lactone lactonase YvrE
MHRDQYRSALTTAALACVVAIVIGACGAGGSSGIAKQSTSSAIPNPFTVTARFTPASLGLKQPIDLAVGPDGNAYVTDVHPSVTVISPAGKVLRRWGKAGSRQGEFSFIPYVPGGPAIVAQLAVGPDGNVYVTDNGNHRVQVFSSIGRFIRQFGGPDFLPESIAVDPQGNVFVADDSDKSVSKFSPSGQRVWSFGGQDENDPDLFGFKHLGTITDAHDRLVIANDDIAKVIYIDEKGHKVDVFDPGIERNSEHSACDITVDGAGNIFVDTSCGGNPGGATLVFDRNHRLTGRWDDTLLWMVPMFAPNGDAFALGVGGSVFRLAVTLQRS